MKTILTRLFLLAITAACNNRNDSENPSAQDTIDFVPGFGGGHEPGKGVESSPSYPRKTYQNEPTVDTTRGIHGVNVDTTGGAR
ncbi:MAG: hypothetical protein ACR2GN_00325 [Bacteroidia bacterium]